MIYTQIIQAISELLQSKREASIPGLGKLYINNYSARIVKEAKQITPPFFKLKLDLDKKLEDRELSDFLVNHFMVNRTKANKAIENWVKACWFTKKANSITFAGLPDHKFIKDKSTYFECADVNILTPNYFGIFPQHIEEFDYGTLKEQNQKQVVAEVSTVLPIPLKNEEDATLVNNGAEVVNETPVASSPFHALEPIAEKTYKKEQVCANTIYEAATINENLLVVKQESTRIESALIEKTIIDKPEEFRIVAMPSNKTSTLQWIGRTAVLLLFLLGALYFILPDGIGNLFSTNIPINQKPGYEKILSSNKEEIPKYQASELEAEETQTTLEQKKPLAMNEDQDATLSESNASEQSLDSTARPNQDDFNYKIIIGRFSNETNINDLKQRLKSEGYHYFEELENGLYTIGVKVNSNATLIHSQVQHFIDYYTWDSYFTRLK